MLPAVYQYINEDEGVPTLMKTRLLENNLKNWAWTEAIKTCVTADKMQVPQVLCLPSNGRHCKRRGGKALTRALGDERLLNEGKYLAEVNLEDLEYSSIEQQEYCIR